MPMIIRWPGITTDPGICHEPVFSCDLFPTLLHMAGLTSQPRQEVDGIDISPLLSDPNGKLERDTLYFHYPHYYPTTTPVSAIRSGDWKLLEYFEDGRVELFDLATDPGEKVDLASDKPEIANRLRRNLNKWRESVDAQLPTPNPERMKNRKLPE